MSDTHFKKGDRIRCISARPYDHRVLELNALYEVVSVEELGAVMVKRHLDSFWIYVLIQLCPDRFELVK